MHRRSLLMDISEYKAASLEERAILDRCKQFVESNSDCFERANESGHVTGSSFVLSPDLSRVLLSFHAKLQKWLQLGGHADGCPDVRDVALREAREESGITQIEPLSLPLIPIDFDIHQIPSNGKQKAHYHYDVRFVFHSLQEKFICSNESLALRWTPLEEVQNYISEPSVLRVIRKIKASILKEAALVGDV